MTHGGYVQISGKRRVGGAVQLLNYIPKQPISKSNQIVGIITPQPARAEMEGALLKNIHFGSHKKDEGRIKFIF